MEDRRRWGSAANVWRLALVLALVFTLGVGPASAKKPVKPPPPDPDPDPTPTASGTLVGSGADGWFTMTPDGDDLLDLDLVAPCTGEAKSYGTVSRERHNEKLWLLQTCEVDGGPPGRRGPEELFVIGEGDSIGLQLTDDATMAFSYY